MTQIVMLAATAAILMIAAVFFPFLEIHASGLSRWSSLLGVVAAFSEGWMLPLTFGLGAMILVLPLARLAALIYTLAPMALGHRPAPHAALAFRWAEAMRPWAMVEIFILGVAISLVKISALADVALGPAFWALAVLVVVTVLKDTLMCRMTVWKTLEERRPS